MCPIRYFYIGILGNSKDTLPKPKLVALGESGVAKTSTIEFLLGCSRFNPCQFDKNTGYIIGMHYAPETFKM